MIGKTILLIDTSYPINTRNSKILMSVSGCEKHVATWNRDNRPALSSKKCYSENIFTSISPYGNKILKIGKLFTFAVFVKKCIKEIKPDYIIASHWDTLLIAVLFNHGKCKLIYENLDMPTANNGFILALLQKLEKHALGKTDAIIFASRFFVEQYPFYRKKTLVLENKPFADIKNEKPAVYLHSTDNIKLSFIGTLRYFDCMKNLITAASGLPIDVLFFGDGPDYSKLKTFSENHDNVYFFGKYNYEDIRCIYELSDIIWAVYPNKDYNVKYAISNKFFESLVFHKPAFFAANTLLGDFVMKNNIGFVVDPYCSECIREKLLAIISNIKMLDTIVKNIKEYNSKSSLFWEDDIQLLRHIFD
ncbi:hypothetical protein FACS189485_16130 [Spirochaetia bacterium]|nr:hypothetical protein FACS189485_16130 [Spirochaetia bacterium]